MNVVISDPKAGKAYSKKIDSPGIFMNKKIGDSIALDAIGLAGYSAKITGGSDSEGFPMKFDLPGMARKKIFLVKDIKTGLRKRISRRGNTVSTNTTQLNLLVTRFGDKKLDELIASPEKKEELSEKEKVMQDKTLLSVEKGKEAKEIKKAK